MTLAQLQDFVEIAHCGSFSRAAENLFISQPNLTKAIAALEKELDMKLFDRSTHHVRLTSDGEHLMEKTELLIAELVHVIDETQIRSHSHSRRINIGISRDELLPDELNELIYRANTDGSGRRCFLIQDSYVGLIAGLRGRQYDIAVTTDRSMRNASGIQHIILRPFEMVLAIRRDHPLADKPDLSPSDFGSEPVFFTVPEGKETPTNVLRAVFDLVGGEFNMQLMDSPRDMMLNVQCGAGAAMITNLIDQSAYPEVIFRQFEKPRGLAQCIAWRENEEDSVILDFIGQIQSVFGEGTPL